MRFHGNTQLILSLSLLVCSLPAHAGTMIPTTTRKVPATASSVVAELGEQRAYALRNAPIHSRGQLRRHVTGAGINRSPLNALTPAARRRFIASLRFNDGGLMAFNSDDLANELTVSQTHDLLALFGAQHGLRMIGGLQVVTPRDRHLRTIFAEGEIEGEFNGCRPCSGVPGAARPGSSALSR